MDLFSVSLIEESHCSDFEMKLDEEKAKEEKFRGDCNLSDDILCMLEKKRKRENNSD